MEQNLFNQSVSELTAQAEGLDHSSEGPMRGTLEDALALPGVSADFSPESFAGPAWNNSSEYAGLESEGFKADCAEVQTLIVQLQALLNNIKPLMAHVLQTHSSQQLPYGEREGLISTLQGFSGLSERAHTLLQNVNAFASCESSVDSRNQLAQKIESQLASLYGKLNGVTKPVILFLQLAPLDVVELYLQHPHTSTERFAIMRSRKTTDLLLSESEETLLSAINADGPNAWGQLYGQIAGTLNCRLQSVGQNGENIETEIGLAQAAGLLRDANEATRKSAWFAIQNAWRAQEVPCAAVLNALAGWRLAIYERRSHTRKIDFLDQPLHESHISRKTLEAMISVVSANMEVPRRAMRAIARGIGKPQLDPWDILAPAPPAAVGSPNTTNETRFELHEPQSHRATDRRTFMQGLSLIRDAFSAVDPSFGEFATLMETNQWIEARVLPNKRQGAYCTGFRKSRTPRVFQTYMGSIADITTLAHEMGHAYHGWVMRDLAAAEREYPMTLAETASIFAETAFAEHMLNAGTPHDRFEVAWQNAESATAFLLNIPARFEFECNLYEARKSGSVSPDELRQMTARAWQNWYGDTLSAADEQYWMTKLHFSISDVSFYNYPYTFGYLFSLGIYALRTKMGPEFHRAYVALLRDTGRMTAEELVMKHLGCDITKHEFWQQSLEIVKGQVVEFEKMVAAN